ncbi:hypothetical protein Tco_1122866 [Tanacetum coccineum]|uniref:Uncharacterized protein n=1 Tax=Tanacetum coccineum TaxID=301880 RepID=A0ABQ5J2A0_9ASTR
MIIKKSFNPNTWPQESQFAFAKPYHMNAPDPSRNSIKRVSFQSLHESVGSNDMVHNYYLEEGKKKAQLQKDKALDSKPSVITLVRIPYTTNGSKPKSRNSYKQPRNWPPSMSSRVSNKVVNIAEPPRKSKPFLNSKRLSMSYMQKKKDAQSHKITKRYIPVEKKSNSKNLGRQIPIGQRFSPKKSLAVYLKTTPPISGLTWKPTDRLFTNVGLRLSTTTLVRWQCSQNISWVSIGKGWLGPRGGRCGGNGRRGDSMTGRGGGLFVEHSIDSNDGRCRGGLVVRGGRSSRKSKRAYGEVGGVEKISSTGSKLMVRGKECLEGCVGASRGEVSGGGDDFRVSKSLLGEIPEVVIGESSEETFGDDGGAVC